jgi:hypothetical protein
VFPARRNGCRQQQAGQSGEHGRLRGKGPERATPAVGIREEAADQRAQQGSGAPNDGDEGIHAPPSLGFEPGFHRDVTEGEQHAAAHALHETGADQYAHGGRGRTRDAADAIEQRRANEEPLDAPPQAEHGRGGAGDDGTHFVQGHGPVDVDDAADVLDDGRRDGGGHERVRRVQPDADAQQA